MALLDHGDCFRMYEIEEFDAWEAGAPEELRSDPLWRMRVYRLASFVADRVLLDARVLVDTRSLIAASDQLTRAVGSIGANLTEGYSRGSGRDRARFFGYALGSAREAIHWYHLAGSVLPPERLSPQIAALVQIKRLLASIIPAERHREIK